MKGKSGNLIMVLREGEAIELDGPGKIIIKKARKNGKTVILVNAADETNIKRESKDVAEKQNDA